MRKKEQNLHSPRWRVFLPRALAEAAALAEMVMEEEEFIGVGVIASIPDMGNEEEEEEEEGVNVEEEEVEEVVEVIMIMASCLFVKSLKSFE
ncbi:hypothetical protein DFQ27_004578 [Actinomortierella ambigua]|uniref:Uncharacterized protein n=1 Tax=Actinomortierella ambigua TaxID=1343610 RepID=A0A9P6QME1_9FUNG|nr:hypothetical protein DFQ27_004578 [Actinomortierella ambigua]